MFTFTVWYSLPEQDNEEDLWMASVNEIYEMFVRRFDSGFKDLGDCDPCCGATGGQQYATFINVPGVDYNDAVERVKGYLANISDLVIDKITEGDDIHSQV